MGCRLKGNTDTGSANASGAASPGVFLLHGVTGSGKRQIEIYLQALAEVIGRGKKGICMVPEIALTPQVIDRFMGRFPGRVAVLHSRLTLGQQFLEYMGNGIRRRGL